MQTLTENERQRWDIDAHGRVNDGQNDCFDGGLALLVNGAQFHGQNNQMTADGSEFVLSSPIGNVVVTRRILLDPAPLRIDQASRVLGIHITRIGLSEQTRGQFGVVPIKTQTTEIRHSPNTSARRQGRTRQP